MENTVKTQSTIPKLKFKNVIGYGCGDAGGVITIYMVAMYMSPLPAGAVGSKCRHPCNNAPGMERVGYSQ